MIKLKKKSNYSPLMDKIIRIPLWKSIQTLFCLPFSFVLFVLGISAVSDGLFDTHFTRPNLGIIGVMIGIVFLLPLFLFIYRLIKYPGIIFTKDFVIISPVLFYHWRKKIIYYNKIKKIEFGGLKHGYRILCDGNKWINFPKHNSTNKLWDEFDHELCKRRSKALKEMGKQK